MQQDFFTYLPSELVINILSRLPIQTTMSCKCVCKPWLDLLVTPEFVKSHLSKSVPGHAMFDWEIEPETNKMIEFDEVGEHCWGVVFNFDLPFYDEFCVHSSANGLFFLCKGDSHPLELFLCNPVTREYITIPPPSSRALSGKESYGFGVSRMSDQYKVVRMFLEEKLPPTPASEFDQYECEVYTVGSGSWRRIASCSPLYFVDSMVGTFLNGNLHWLVGTGSSVQISCLDLETELFRTFSPPPPLADDRVNYRNLSVLRDCLCVCDHSVDEEHMTNDEIDIWLMKEYRDEKSWTKEFIIRKVDMKDYFMFICPIKVFEDGDILMVMESCKPIYYSSKNNAIRGVDMYRGLNRSIFICRTIYAPSFVPLKAFEMENVRSF